MAEAHDIEPQMALERRSRRKDLEIGMAGQVTH